MKYVRNLLVLLTHFQNPKSFVSQRLFHKITKWKKGALSWPPPRRCKSHQHHFTHYCVVHFLVVTHYTASPFVLSCIFRYTLHFTFSICHALFLPSIGPTYSYQPWFNAVNRIYSRTKHTQAAFTDWVLRVLGHFLCTYIFKMLHLLGGWGTRTFLHLVFKMLSSVLSA